MQYLDDPKGSCGIVTRETTGPCPDDITHIVLPPYGGRKYVCAAHAAGYAGSGFIVREIANACMACGGLKPAKNALFICWCGGVDGARRYFVDGYYFVCCAAHKPPELSRLWLRTWWKIVFSVKRFFTRPTIVAWSPAEALEQAKKRRLKK